MVNYKNGKIYKIQCFVTNKIYIGSTSQFYLSQRLKDHVEDYIKYMRNPKKQQEFNKTNQDI